MIKKRQKESTVYKHQLSQAIGLTSNNSGMHN